jgi:hypothetical protein
VFPSTTGAPPPQFHLYINQQEGVLEDRPASIAEIVGAVTSSDCGLFAYSRPAAKAKLRAMVKGAELARQELQAGASGAAARTQSP